MPPVIINSDVTELLLCRKKKRGQLFVDLLGIKEKKGKGHDDNDDDLLMIITTL